MSGTSVDGVDFVLCQKGKSFFSYIDQFHRKFPLKLKSQILKAAHNTLDFWSVAQLHYDLGEFFSKSLNLAVKQKNWKFDLVGLHGQTVYHKPQKCTIQLGEPSYIRKDFGVPVVAQFRNMDIALEGQGAPLAPFFHRELMRGESKVWAFQNLGGMGNVTYIGKKSKGVKKKWGAFDTGPANILIDEYMMTLFSKPFDKGGKIAAQGIPNEKMIQQLFKRIRYFEQKPPKSCGREVFSKKSLGSLLKGLNRLSKEDQIATLTEFTARTLKHQYETFLNPIPELIILSGGGAKNFRLVKRIQFLFPQSNVETSESYLNWPVDAVEGGAFAWMAYQRFNEIKTKDLAFVTGSKAKEGLLGSIY